MKYFIQYVDCSDIEESKPYIISGNIVKLSEFINGGRYHMSVYKNDEAVEDIEEYYLDDRNAPGWEYSEDPVDHLNELVVEKLHEDMLECLESKEEFVYMRIIREC